MVRVVFAFLVVVFSFILNPQVALAEVKVTSNINHKGWYEVSGETQPYGKIKPVVWKDVKSDCQPCKYLVMEYNFAMQEVLRRRYLVKLYNEMQLNSDAQYVDLYKDQHKGKKGSVASDGARIGEILERAERNKNSRDWSESKVKIAENRAQKLRELVSECEKQCKGKPGKKTDIKIGGKPKIKGSDPKNADGLYSYTPPKWWKGPFDEVCFKCAKLAKELNERIPHEIKVREIEVAHRRRLEKDLANEYGEGMASTPQGEIYRLEDHYKKTLKMYNDCIKTCPKKVGCVVPDASSTRALAIGPNSEVGSGAAMKDKIKGQAKGMVFGALNKGLGGSGLSLGGGKSKKPKTVKDPTRKMGFVKNEIGDLEFGTRASFNDDGNLLISSKIFDAPGDGTFHATWLENGQGEVILPTQYLLFSLYQDWKLTVWWTYDRYVDGQHVEHDQGEEVSFGRNELGDFAVRYEGTESINNSIWHQMGFNNASKGVKGLGTVFPVTAAMLSGPCSHYLITHVSQPKEDPVTTIPVLHEIPLLGEMFKGGEKKPEKNLMVLIQPTIINDAE